MRERHRVIAVCQGCGKNLVKGDTAFVFEMNTIKVSGTTVTRGVRNQFLCEDCHED